MEMGLILPELVGMEKLETFVLFSLALEIQI
jgi:hypothetical protein